MRSELGKLTRTLFAAAGLLAAFGGRVHAQSADATLRVRPFAHVAPADASALTVSSTSVEGQLRLSWTAPSVLAGSQLDAYQIRVHTFAVGSSTAAWWNAPGGLLIQGLYGESPGQLVVRTLGPAGSSHVVSLIPGGTYYAAVRSADDLGSSFDFWSSASTGPAASPLEPGLGAPVLDLARTAAVSTGAIRFSWTYAGPAAGGFRLVSSTGGALSPDLPASARSYDAPAPGPNQPFPARVQAFKGGATADTLLVRRYTLAEAPASLGASAALERSLDLAWPAGANPSGTGYRLERSGSASGPFSLVSTGTALAQTDSGLAESTTYYYRLAALNGDSRLSAYFGPEALATASIPPGAVLGLAAASDLGIAHRADLSWRNPADADTAGVLVLRSTAPVAFTPSQRASYAAGQDLGGAVVVYNGPGSTSTFSFADTGLTNFTTYYYAAYARDGVPNYGAAAAARVLVLPPVDAMPPAEVAALDLQFSADSATVTLNWSEVEVNADHTPIEDLIGYQVLRSTQLGGAPDLIVELPPGSTTYSEPAPSGLRYYQVVAVDYSRNRSAAPAYLTSETNPRFFFVQDSTLVQGSAELRRKLKASGNSTGKDLMVRAGRVTARENALVLRSINVDLVEVKSGRGVSRSVLGDEALLLSFSYGASTSVPSALAHPLSAPPPDAVAPTVFFETGVDWLRLGGENDPRTRTVSLLSPNLGLYEVRQASVRSGFFFDPTGVRPRIFTPNGDGRNDKVFFIFDNPGNSPVGGEILDVNGGRVAALTQAGPYPGISLEWDGKDASGRTVPPGVYVYKLEAEGKVYTGTVVVAR